VTELILPSQVEDSTYTCKISGNEEYSFFASVEINDLSLKPEAGSRVFTGTVLTLTCTYISTIISEGSFSWIFSDQSCLTAACSNPANTPKTSKLTLTVDSSNAGSYRCSFTKKNGNKEIRSNEVRVSAVSLTGSVTSASVWGLVGSESSVTCVVPAGLTDTALTSIRWLLDDNAISEEGAGFNKNSEVVQFTISDAVSTATDKTSVLSFTHSLTAVGTLHCTAAYQPERNIIIPSTHINVMTLNSDVDTIILTPSNDAKVTFTTQSNSRPTTLPNMPSGTATSVSTEEADLSDSDGILFTEVVKFSSTSSEVTSEEQLSRKEYSFTYTVNAGSASEIVKTGTAFLIGETFVKSREWATIGERTTLTAFFTSSTTASVSVVWQQEDTADSEWKDIASDGYTTILSEMDDKGVMSTILVIDKTRESDATGYRTQVQIASLKETTAEIHLKAVTATMPDVAPVFEKDTVTFSVTVEGPDKPSSVLLAHQESGKEEQVALNTVSLSSPFPISHVMNEVYSSDSGFYHFKVIFESGLEYETTKVELIIKLKCKPLTTPPNTELKEEEITDSNNYRIFVTCSESSYVVMDESLKEVICDTSTGTYNKTILTPCLRTIQQT